MGANCACDRLRALQKSPVHFVSGVSREEGNTGTIQGLYNVGNKGIYYIRLECRLVEFKPSTHRELGGCRSWLFRLGTYTQTPNHKSRKIANKGHYSTHFGCVGYSISSS